MTKPKPRTGGRLIVDALLTQGVDTVFCVPGESYLAVLDAYGWHDIRPACEFELEWEDDDAENGRHRKKPWRYRWPEPVRDEVLARLLALNAQRAEEERLALGDK